MTIASLITRGIGPDSSITAAVLRGFSTFQPMGNLLPVRGFGPASTIGGVLLRGFTQIAATQQQVVCTTTSYTGLSLQDSQSPAVAVGDTFYADFVTTPGGYKVTVAGDGTVTVDGHFDGSRQTFNANIFSVSMGAFYGAFKVVVNNHGPQVNLQPADIKTLTGYPISLNFTPIDPNAPKYMLDQDGDPMTSSLLSGSLPSGMSFAGNVLSGTPLSAVNNPITLQFADAYGVTKNLTMNLLSDTGQTVPKMVGLTSDAANAALKALGLTLDNGSSLIFSNSAAAGIVISQSVDSGSVVFSGSSIVLTVSRGSQFGASIRVQAVTAGVYAGQYYQPGDVFDLATSNDYSDSTQNYQINGNEYAAGWMIQVASSTPLFQAAPQPPAPLFPAVDAARRTVM